MKNLILLLLLYLTGIMAKCQTFSAAFNAIDNIDGDAGSYYSDVDGLLGGVETYTLESYLNMFKATKDMHYLEKFAIQATRMMERRDEPQNKILAP